MATAMARLTAKPTSSPPEPVSRSATAGTAPWSISWEMTAPPSSPATAPRSPAASTPLPAVAPR
jgi:hypothetical protein